MYQPVYLDSFLRMLVAHLTKVIDEGEQLLEFNSRKSRAERLLAAIESEDGQKKFQSINEQETLFVLEVCHAREWVDRLGQLDHNVERIADEFLAVTYAMERLIGKNDTRALDYLPENLMTTSNPDQSSHFDLGDRISIQNVIFAIYELLTHLEEQYELVEEFLDHRLVANGAMV